MTGRFLGEPAPLQVLERKGTSAGGEHGHHLGLHLAELFDLGLPLGEGAGCIQVGLRARKFEARHLVEALGPRRPSTASGSLPVAVGSKGPAATSPAKGTSDPELCSLGTPDGTPRAPRSRRLKSRNLANWQLRLYREAPSLPGRHSASS
jgi:hypothetical protein